MQDGWSAIVVVLLFIESAVLFVRLRQGAATSDDERGLPRALMGAEIAYAERTFRSVSTRLVARLDRAYRVDGELKLVELKTRARDVVYMSDIVEMSVQRIAVRDEACEAVSIDAWVVVQNSDTGVRRPHKVRLLGLDEIARLVERYREVAGGRITAPNPARSPSQCRQCSHCDRCSATLVHSSPLARRASSLVKMESARGRCGRILGLPEGVVHVFIRGSASSRASLH